MNAASATASLAARMMSSARMSLVLDSPFFGRLSLRLNLVEDASQPTAWIDGVTLAFNPGFVEKMTHAERVGLIAHEVMHAAAGHCWRRDARKMGKWNAAADYAINGILERSGFTLPQGGLLEPQWDGKSAEHIYDRLPDEDEGEGWNKPSPQGEVRDAPPEAQAAGASEADWQTATQQAANEALQHGSQSADLKRFVKEVLTPRVDWRSVTRRFVQQLTNADFSWSRPNSRYIQGGMYRPSLRSEQLGPIVVAVDTSGSIDKVQLAQFAAEVREVAQEAQPSKIVVMYCDAEVNAVEEFERGDEVTMTPHGGGGTSFVAAMDAVDEMDEQPACMIYLTDGCGSHRKEPPSVPLLWALTQESTVPYGEVVFLNG